MPYTPYHFGPGLFLGVVLFPYIDFSTVMVASVILDIEPATILMLQLPFQFHGFFHTYLGATIIACILSVAFYPLRRHLNKLVSLFGLHQESSFRHIFFASIIGTYFHVFLDSLLYGEMHPFYPLVGNPFLGTLSITVVYSSCIYLGLLGIGVFALRILYRYHQQNKVELESDVFSAF